MVLAKDDVRSRTLVVNMNRPQFPSILLLMGSYCGESERDCYNSNNTGLAPALFAPIVHTVLTPHVGVAHTTAMRHFE